MSSFIYAVKNVLDFMYLVAVIIVSSIFISFLFDFFSKKIDRHIPNWIPITISIIFALYISKFFIR